MRQAKTVLYPLLVAGLIWAAGSGTAVRSQTAVAPAVTVFEGARLITGDGSAPIALPYRDRHPRRHCPRQGKEEKGHCPDCSRRRRSR